MKIFNYSKFILFAIFVFFGFNSLFISKVYALDYTYDSIWAGRSSSSSSAFSINANSMINGSTQYYTPMAAKQDYLLVSYCASGKVTAVFSDSGQLGNQPYFIDSKTSCSAYGTSGTVYYSYFPVKYWNYTDNNNFAYIDTGTSYFRNWESYSVRVAFYGIQNVSGLDLSMAILANLESTEDKDYNSILNEIKNNQKNYTEELEQVQGSINQANGKLDDVNDNLSDLNNNLTNSDSSGASSDAGDFFNGFNTDTFGLTSIITSPLNLIKSITSSSCSSLKLPLPFVNKDLTLPCMNSIYQQYFGSFLTLYQTITFGFVAYWVCVRIFNLVKDFKNPEHDEVEVLDL